MIAVVALFAGLVFGLGLIVSGMTDPNTVLAFLDLRGSWNPSLAFVMVGAIAVSAPAFALVKRRTQSLLNEPIRLAVSKQLDLRLTLGSLVFGVGWGVAGFCPGPSVVAIGMGSAKGLVFFAAMLLGMGIFEVLERARLTRQHATPNAAEQ